MLRHRSLKEFSNLVGIYAEHTFLDLELLGDASNVEVNQTARHLRSSPNVEAETVGQGHCPGISLP